MKLRKKKSLQSVGFSRDIYYLDGLPVLFRDIYGEGKFPDLVFLNQHTNRDLSFLEKYRDLFKPFKEDPDVFFQYLDLERDNGVEFFTDNLRMLCEAGFPEKRIDVVWVNFPRGIIDTNRHYKFPELAVREIVERDNKNLMSEFLEIHNLTVAEIENIISQISENGVFIDIHSMNDHCLKKTPENGADLEVLRRFISAYTDSKNFKRKRKFNFIVSLKEKSLLYDVPVNTNILNGKLLDAIMDVFDRNEVDYAMDEPYLPRDFVMTTYYCLLKSGRGMWFDYPISYFAENGKSSNIDPVLSREKIQWHAGMWFDALRAFSSK